MVIRMEVGRNSHTLDARRGRRMTGSAGTVLDVVVSCDSSNGRRVWGEGGEILTKIRPCGSPAGEGWRNYFECFFRCFFYLPVLSKCL